MDKVKYSDHNKIILVHGNSKADWLGVIRRVNIFGVLKYIPEYEDIDNRLKLGSFSSLQEEKDIFEKHHDEVSNNE